MLLHRLTQPQQMQIQMQQQMQHQMQQRRLEQLGDAEPLTNVVEEEDDDESSDMKNPLGYQ